jgi:hypothetical protein
VGMHIVVVDKQRPVRKTFIPLTLSESFTGAAETLSETLRESWWLQGNSQRELSE